MYRNFLAFLSWALINAFDATTNYTEEVHFLNKYIVKIVSKKNNVKIILKDADGNKLFKIGTWDRKIKCITDARITTLESIIDYIEFNETDKEETQDAINK